MTISFDTNFLVYVFDTRDPQKQSQASELFDELIQTGSKIAGQVLTEFLNVSHKKKLFDPALARSAITELASVFEIVEQNVPVRVMASDLAFRRKLQFYDALLCKTLELAGVSMLLSEDMADGETYEGLLILNPFNPANADRIAAALR